MAKQFWINLPVKDIAKSKGFFNELGFSFNSRYGNTDHSACLIIGEKQVVVMLFAESMFEKMAGNEIASTAQTAEVLLSIDAESRAEVDEMARKAVKAGGTLYAPPRESQGWMYGCGFADLDGHRWNVLYMDMSKMP